MRGGDHRSFCSSFHAQMTEAHDYYDNLAANPKKNQWKRRNEQNLMVVFLGLLSSFKP